VREGENVLVTIRAFADVAECRAFCTDVALGPGSEDLAAWLDRETVMTVLAPTTAAGRH
jgi:hypothetical protein